MERALKKRLYVYTIGMFLARQMNSVTMKSKIG